VIIAEIIATGISKAELVTAHDRVVRERHPSGQHVHVRRFKTQSEAKYWIARKSKAWLKKQGSSMTSRQMKDSGDPASIDLFSPQCRKIPLIYL
jgi:hypothetical protein